jgi:hypothetical protein
VTELIRYLLVAEPTWLGDHPHGLTYIIGIRRQLRTPGVGPGRLLRQHCAGGQRGGDETDQVAARRQRTKPGVRRMLRRRSDRTRDGAIALRASRALSCAAGGWPDDWKRMTLTHYAAPQPHPGAGVRL